MTDAPRDPVALDCVIHEPARLLLMALLDPAERADFVYMLRQTDLTKGNLGAHLTRLEAAGYLEITKGYRGKVPQTTCRLTETGRAAFRAYHARMRAVLAVIPDEWLA